jgi:hypothetical protein
MHLHAITNTYMLEYLSSDAFMYLSTYMSDLPGAAAAAVAPAAAVVAAFETK